MLTVQRWYPDTCECAFYEAFEDGLPDDVLPGSENARPYNGYHAETVEFVSRLEGERIKQLRRDRITTVTEKAKVDFFARRLDIERVYDAFHSRNSIERGLQAFDEDELQLVRNVNIERFKAGLPIIDAFTYFNRASTQRRQELFDFLYGRASAKPSSGINSTPLQSTVICVRHEDMMVAQNLTTLAIYEEVKHENRVKNETGIWPSEFRRLEISQTIKVR